MKEKQAPVVVTILGKEYKIACPDSEQEALISTSKILDQHMREIRDTGKVVGADRIAVMAALNLIHDLNLAKIQLSSQSQDLSTRLINLRNKIDNVLKSALH